MVIAVVCLGSAWELLVVKMVEDSVLVVGNHSMANCCDLPGSLYFEKGYLTIFVFEVMDFHFANCLWFVAFYLQVVYLDFDPCSFVAIVVSRLGYLGSV